MEDIPRDLQKEIDSYKAPAKGRKSGHWTLLFVGDQGEVITIRKFKGLLLLAIFIMVVALSAATTIYMLYKKPFEENRRLQGELAKVGGQIRTLGEERDLLLTRLGIAESKLKKAQAAAQTVTAASEKDATQVGEPAEAAPLETAAAPVAPAAPAASAEPEPPAEKKVPPTGAPEELKPETKVDVRDFQVRHEPDQRLLNVQFRLKNVNVEAGAVSGRTFVVLKNDQDPEAEILTIPKARLVDGKPARIHRGRYFSISRFNIVKLKSAYKTPPLTLNRATVFVYSGAGDLLLEKQFAIEDPFIETAAPAAPGNDQQPGGAGESEATQEGFEPANTILNN